MLKKPAYTILIVICLLIWGVGAAGENSGFIKPLSLLFHEFDRKGEHANRKAPVSFRTTALQGSRAQGTPCLHHLLYGYSTIIAKYLSTQ